MRVGVILSGCGVFDGSEIHEAVLTLLALDLRGAQAICAAPDVDQHHVVDHLTGQPAAGERRNVLRESARIARGRVRDLAALNADDVDALLFPGGYGAAKNLSTFAFEGADHTVHPQVTRIVQVVRAQGKPVAFVCIAPALAARLIPGATVTIGDDPSTAAALTTMGARHVVCAVDDFVVDDLNRVITSPAYMHEASISGVWAGIQRTVGALIEMAS